MKIFIFIVSLFILPVNAMACDCDKNRTFDPPYTWLNNWVKEEMEISELDSMDGLPVFESTLATVNEHGQPQARIVQVANVDSKEGLIFYTHANTQKALALENNPKAALNFWFPNSKRQVGVEGTVTQLPQDKINAVWYKMPRWMQLTLSVSDHKSNINSRKELDIKIADLDLKYKDKDLPLPKDFIGYVFKPNKYVFFEVYDKSFADKFIVTKNIDKAWITERKQP